MKRPTLTEWAAVAEIIGTIAVVISLLFVGFSINRNTAATQASSENILFERHTDIANLFLIDPALAELLHKKRIGASELSGIESIRWEKYELNMLDIWALAYSRHQRALLSQSQWETWDRYFAHMFSEEAVAISRDRWEELRYGFDPVFWEHVRAALFGQVK